MKTRQNAGSTRLSRSKQSTVKDQPCQQISADVKTDKRPSNVTAGGRDKRVVQEASTPKNKSRRSQKGVVQSAGVRTPGVRDDLICSQHFDSQVVVGWDCLSPDTLRGIKRFSGTEEKDEVSDLLSRLIEEEPDISDLQKRSTPPLLGVWRDNKTGKLTDNESGLQQRLRKRHGRRKKNSDVLKNLTRALDRCAEDAECEEKDGDDTVHVDTRSDVCPSIKPSPSSIPCNTSVTIHSEKQGSKACNTVSSETISEISEDTWSDDDLFDDDSFIIKATQLPDTLTSKFISPVFGTKRKSSGDNEAPKSKTSRYTFQLEHDSPVYSNKLSSNKSNCVPSKQHPVLTVQSLSSCKNDYGPASKIMTNNNCKKPPVFKPTVPSSKPSVNTSRMCVVSSRPVIAPVSVNNYTSKTAGSSQQTMMSHPKHIPASSKHDYSYNLPKPTSSLAPKPHTTSVYQSNITSTNSVKANTSVHDGRASFKKHNSFSGPDTSNLSAVSRRRSVSGGNSLTMPNKPYIHNNSKTIIGSSTSNTIRQIHTNSITKQNIEHSYKNTQKSVSGLNTTTTRSAVGSVNKDDSISTTKSPSSGIESFYKKKLNDSAFDTSISDDLLCQLAEPDDLLDNFVVETTVCGKPSSTVNDNITNKPVIESKQLTSNIASTYDRSNNIKEGDITRKPAAPSAPHLYNWGINCEDLFSSDDDDGLTEPEVLAMLDEVELLATQQSSSQKQVTVKQGTDRTLPEQCHTEIQGFTELAQGIVDGHDQLNGSQETSSQNKYSQSDIEKKKQEALARRRMKMKK